MNIPEGSPVLIFSDGGTFSASELTYVRYDVCNDQPQLVLFFYFLSILFLFSFFCTLCTICMINK